MPDPEQLISVDDAMAEFQAIAREVLADASSGARASTPDATPEQMEESRFRLAEYVLSLACPDPRACADHRCRRQVLCRHFERVQAKRASGLSNHPRRTPGAEALRYAVWVVMNSGR